MKRIVKGKGAAGAAPVFDSDVVKRLVRLDPQTGRATISEEGRAFLTRIAVQETKRQDAPRQDWRQRRANR